MMNKIGKVLESEYKSYFDKISSKEEKYLNAKKIIISDVDGILTESSSYYTADGKVMKKFGAYDTEMINFMKTQGWDFLFVSKDKKSIYDFVVYIGDSLSDIALFREADFGATVNNAPDIVKEYAQYVAKHNGGFGGFADICFYLHYNVASIF